MKGLTHKRLRLLFLLEAYAQVRGLHALVCQSATLAERIDNKLLAPTATALPLVFAEDRRHARFIGVGEDARARCVLHEWGFFRRCETRAAARANKSLSHFLESVIDGLSSHERDLAAYGTLDFHGFHNDNKRVN